MKSLKYVTWVEVLNPISKSMTFPKNETKPQRWKKVEIKIKSKQKKKSNLMRESLHRHRFQTEVSTEEFWKVNIVHA